MIRRNISSSTGIAPAQNAIKKSLIGMLMLTGVFSLSALAAEQVIVNKIYSEKGEAGEQTFSQVSENKYEGKLKLAWNNRRLLIDDTLTVNDKGLPINYTAEGQSAFGAKIQESFSWRDGVVTWQSLKDEGQKQTNQTGFYVPSDNSGSANNMLVKALLKSPTRSLTMFPNGTATLKELKSVEVENNGKKATVKLYAISGMGFNPDFAWYDEDGNFFAKDMSGFMRVIRDGFSLDNFEHLKTIQKQAEQQYLEELARELTYQYDHLLIKNVNVVDVEQSKVIANQDVWLADGKIEKIVDTGQPHTAEHDADINKKKPFVVDGRGKTLIPALWDMHGHLSKNDGLLNIASGVVNVRDVGNSHDNIMEVERLFDSNKVIGSRVYRAGFLDQYSQYSAGLSVRSLEEAHEKIDWFADNGYLQIKLYSSINPKWVKPMAEHAHRRGMRVSGHVPAFMTAKQAIERGYDEIQHVNMLFLNFLAGTKVDTRKKLRFSLIGEKAGEMDLNSKKMNDFIKLLADKKIVVDPTVSTFRTLLLGKPKQMSPEYIDIADHLPPSVVRSLKGAEMSVADDQLDSYQKGADALVAMIKKLYDNKVTFVPGTDHIAGITIHRELELYAQAGIPNIEVLKIASLVPAQVVGAAHKTGSIAEGKYADLLLIDGDPTKDMSDIRNGVMVFKGSQYYKPNELFSSIGVKPFVKSQDIAKAH
ncbi:amidohydrolase family protein [Flocculibacter collagenilyticus]|uniref:amidohydrolase family protein n=1 Tax=Flocculibacter collagenilyticus TaxID=2744479 RepID=UPI0018F43CD3|nr:amidohydrolase family protein [Flocculibacter collagenilyticus]